MAEEQAAMLGDKVRALAMENDAAGIRVLAGMGVSVGHPNRAGQTALHIGSLWGCAEAVQTLLELRADPNKVNSMRGAAPLHSTASGRGPPEKRAECVKLLIAGRANPELRDQNGNRPIDCADDEVVMLALGAAPLILHDAVKAKNSSALTSALNEIRALHMMGRAKLTLEDRNPSGQTALHLAATLGWDEGVDALLSARASALEDDNLQQSPLHVAVLSGNLDNVSLLINAKGNVNFQDRDIDNDPRFSSQTFKEDPYSNRSPLHYAAEMSNVLMAKLLLEAKADVNLKDSKLETPLHLCIESQRNEEAKLERGSGVSLQGLQKKPDWNGKLASIMGVKASGTAETARWPVMLTDSAREGVLLKEENLKRTSDEMLSLLLDARADVNLGNHVMGESRTCLHDAARFGEARLLQQLLSSRADVNHKDVKLGMTALHLAARSKHDDVIRLLVEARADLLIATAGGKTAAELAETNAASPATLALLGGSEVSEGYPTKSEEPQTLATLSAEQRALLFLD